MSQQSTPTLVLVPGFWLGAWAWDDVLPALVEAGVPARAVTLPGLSSSEEDRSAITLQGHVDAIADAVRGAADGPDSVVLVSHSGAGPVAHLALAEVSELVRSVVYVDTFVVPEGTQIRGDWADGRTEVPLPSWEALVEEGESLEGLSEEQREHIRAHALPEPALVATTPLPDAGDAARAIPALMINTSVTSEQVRDWIGSDAPMMAELRRMSIEMVELPTSHWPMWSEPVKLAAVLVSAARG